MLAYRGFPSSPKKKTTTFKIPVIRLGNEKPLCVDVPQSRVLGEKDGSRKNMKEDIIVSQDVPPNQQKASLLCSSHTQLSFGCIPFPNVQLVWTCALSLGICQKRMVSERSHNQICVPNNEKSKRDTNYLFPSHHHCLFLAYTGISSPSHFIPSRCRLTTNIIFTFFTTHFTTQILTLCCTPPTKLT